jgi:flavin-dependent dehydrogenase
MQKFDCLIVGGGIVGVAVARNLQSTFSHFKCLLVEKENILGLKKKKINLIKFHYYYLFQLNIKQVIIPV